MYNKYNKYIIIVASCNTKDFYFIEYIYYNFINNGNDLFFLKKAKFINLAHTVREVVLK